MTVSIKPDFEKFIDEQVKAGRFASRSEALEAGVARLMDETYDDLLDSQDRTEIRDSLDQMQRGEVIDASELRRRLEQLRLKK